MKVFLYDSINALPEDDGNHILVFAGRGSLLQEDLQDMVTEVLCRYRLGGNNIEFSRNGDAENTRFEQAFSWAVKYAAARGIECVYGVYELDRPLDMNHLHRIFASGVVDRREKNMFEDDQSPDSALLCPSCSAALSKTPVQFETTINAV